MLAREEATTGVVALSLAGTRVDVRVAGPGAESLERAVRRAWDRCAAVTQDLVARPTATTVSVLVDPDESALADARRAGIVAARDEARAMQALTERLTLAAIEAHRARLLMLHACAVADPITGATVVLAARSGGGKTTAAAVLGRHFGYVTDEAVAVRPDGGIVPFPKPLSLLVDGGHPKRQQSPAELGLLVSPDQPWLAGVALLERDPAATGTVVSTVPTVEALALLAGHTSALRSLHRPLHVLAGHLLRTGGLRRISYADADALTPWVADLIGAAS